MRTLNVEEISKNIKEMCIEANHFLSKDMDIAMKNAVSTEKSPLGKKILSQLQDNLKIAGKDMIQSARILEWQSYFLRSDRMYISKAATWKMR